MGKFNFIKMSIDAVTIIEPTVYGDHLGYFMESYNKLTYVGNLANLKDIEGKTNYKYYEKLFGNR